MLRFLKIGDIFCFRYDGYIYHYRFGRIIADEMFHIVEIFDYASDQPVLCEEDIGDLLCPQSALLHAKFSVVFLRGR